jgi:PAS domain S-box-containing protein
LQHPFNPWGIPWHQEILFVRSLLIEFAKAETEHMDNPTILVLDDSQSDYEMYVRYLSESSPNTYRMKLVSRGEDLLNSGDENPHCLLLDLNLPDMNGLELIRQLKERNGGKMPYPIMLATSGGDDTAGHRAVQLGAQDYLVKEELTPQSLRRAIGFAVARFRLEAQVRAGEERFRTLADNMSQFAWMTDQTGWVLWYNQRWFDYTGTTLEEVRGWGWQKVHHPDHVQRVVDKIARCFATGEEWEDTFPLRAKDGSYRWFLSRAVPIRNADGRVERWFGTNTDITEQRNIEEALRQSKELTEAKVQTRTQQLAETLAAVQSEAQVRKQAEQQLRVLSARLLRLQDEERRRIARELHDSVGQLLTAIKMNIAVTRSTSLEPKAAKALAENEELVNQISAEIRTISHLLHPPLLDEVGFSSAAQWCVEGFTQRSGIQVSLDLSAAPHLSKEQELALFRVLQESLSNILRHSGSMSAEVRLFSEGDTAVLSIRDYGKGIPTDELAIFSQTGAGVGVGLGGMKQRVRDLGGHLKVRSDLGGTTVLVSLPLSQSDQGKQHDPDTAPSREPSAA